MASVTFPFTHEAEAVACDHGPACSLNAVLPKPLQAACQDNVTLSEYLHWVPLSEIGVPEYYPKISRDLSYLERRNLIYPISGDLYVHIYPNDRGDRDHYIPIEPHLTVNLDAIVPQVESKLLGWVKEIGAAENDAEKKTALLKAIDASVSDNGSTNKIQVTPREMAALKYLLVRDKVGFGLLAPLLQDPNIEDISCSGVGPIFIEHKVFKSIESAITFGAEEELDDFVIWLGEWIKRPVTVRNPIVDAVLPDGSRINIVYGTDVSKRGSNFTIRKFAGIPTSVMELIDYGTLDYMMAAYLSFILEEGLNLFVAGATASGKTTTMNAITTFIPSDKKIVSIEDTPELQVPHKNWIRETTRGSSKENTGAEVGMFDLLKAALRQRPDRIVIGEIRGEEGAIAFQAMQTGHGVMSTFHAASVEKLIQRLTGDPINIPKAYVDNLEVVLIQQAVRVPGRGMVRRVTSVNEIVGYDPTSESFSFIEAFRWNPATDTFEFPGFMNSYLLEERIASKRGIPPFKRKVIYTELKRRAKIFQRLHVERKLKNFYDVFQVLAEAQHQKLL
ncbi:MAG TPA: type II/IV secretion system ATPase subunit [Anaerolineae bacterium]|nr:type II/IV secretion system ATPase subunit [Anaerolineae bacterium]